MQSSSVRSPGSENLVLDPEVVQPGPARPVVAVDDEADNLGLLVQGADSHQRDSVLYVQKGELQIIVTFAVSLHRCVYSQASSLWGLAD